ncbi:hypothetical protein C0Q70_12880 [Pomacea canaliculata]|uniref:Uncharacterized protein n=1 Tax=Pomacea canaliculata TaxID=400727 RepID=A0A2T7P2Q6_POMCA|nr:hypothetical protein C0Q70_12880 [Pomacea canaliculata]
MVLRTENELLRLLSTFALFYLGFSLNCSHTIDTRRWSVDVVCTDVIQEIPGNKYECLMRANPNYLKGDVKGDVWVGGVTGTPSSRMVKLKCSTRFNLPNSTDAYTYNVFFGSVWSSGKRIIELKLANSERKDMDTTQSSTITIVSVVGTVVLVVIIITTVIVIVIIRTKRNQLKNSPPSPEPTENLYYVDCLSDNGKDFVMSGDDYADITDCTRHAADTVMPDLYTSVKTEEGIQTTQADVYANVEKNKQHGESEVYALVVKPQGKQPAKADNSSARGDFTHEADVYAVVDKGANKAGTRLLPYIGR